MAIKLEKSTDAKKVLKLISVVDSAINWDESYSDPQDLNEDEEETKKSNGDSSLPDVGAEDLVELPLLERKKAHYSKYHDESKLRFKENDLPTLFVFCHPHRADVSRKMRELASAMYADSQRGKKEKIERDTFSAVFHSFYLGREEGFSGERIDAPRMNHRITDDTIQELEDAEVFIELNAAFMRVYNQDRTKRREKEHSEK